MKKLVIASHNQGKIGEIRTMLVPLGIEVVCAAQLGLEEPEETGSTFAENAILKSRAAAIATGEYALSDDSGLCVEALEGAPGIYSARWAGENKDFMLASETIYQELKNRNINPEGASAYFACVLAISSPREKIATFEGRIEGTLTFPGRGDKGFGYDPIFIPQGYAMTFAEMDFVAKHAISHRARAFAQFMEYLNG